MSKKLEQRMTKLEHGATNERQRITRIELVDGVTGEVGAVINIGGPPTGAEGAGVKSRDKPAR